MEAKRRRREKKLNDVSEVLYAKGFSGILVASIFVGIAFLVGLIVGIVRGNLFDSFGGNAVFFAGSMGDRLERFAQGWNKFDPGDAVGSAFVTAFTRLSALDVPGSLKDAVGTVGSHALGSLTALGENLAFCLPEAARFRFFPGFLTRSVERIVCLKAFFDHFGLTAGNRFRSAGERLTVLFCRIGIHVKRFFSTIFSLVQSSVESVHRSGEFVRSVFSKLKKD